MSETVTGVGIALLAVALIGLVIYSYTLWQLLTRGSAPGLIRTAVVRCAGSLLYGVSAVLTLIGRPFGPILGLAAVCALQCGYWACSVLDLGIARGTQREEC